MSQGIFKPLKAICTSNYIWFLMIYTLKIKYVNKSIFFFSFKDQEFNLYESSYKRSYVDSLERLSHGFSNCKEHRTIQLAQVNMIYQKIEKWHWLFMCLTPDWTRFNLKTKHSMSSDWLGFSLSKLQIFWGQNLNHPNEAVHLTPVQSVQILRRIYRLSAHDWPPSKEADK